MQRVAYRLLIGIFIDSIQMDQAMASKAIQLYAWGEPPAKRLCREAQTFQQRLRTLCFRRRAGELTIAEFLMAVGHNLRFTDSVSTEVPTPATETMSQPAPASRQRSDRANVPTPQLYQHPHTICCVIGRCCRSDIYDIIHIRFAVLFFTYHSTFILYLSGIHD